MKIQASKANVPNWREIIVKPSVPELKHEISLTFMRTQNLIISSYFDKAFNSISIHSG